MGETKKVLKRVKIGRVVVIDYKVRLTTGKVVDSSKKSGGGPVAFVCGKGDFPKPVEEGVIGLLSGEQKLIIVPPQFTYGHYDPRKVSLVATERISEEIEIGKVVKAPDEFGLKRPALVRSVWNGALMLDFNHPLAGKTLHFEIFVREVRDERPAAPEVDETPQHEPAHS